MTKITFSTYFFVLFMFCSIASISIDAQTAYGISIIRGNESTRIVDGYSGTWLDYVAGYYYDRVVMGEIYRADNPETTLASGSHIGFGDILPAEVYLWTNNYVEGKTYCTFSQHFIWSYFVNATNSWWFDPFRYSLMGTGYPPWGGFPYSLYYVIPRRHRLGSTQACITIPNPPTPTPTPRATPTPTPNPTPTPCDPGNLGCAPYIVYIPAIAPVRPTGTSSYAGGRTTTQVSVCIEPAQANLQATLRLINRPQHLNSGGHFASYHTGSRPLGKLARTTGVTGSNGCFTTTYSPPHVSGIIGVDGTITGTSVGADIQVRVDGLFPLGTGPDHTLIGQTNSHPDNHYALGIVNQSLRQIAADYRSEFYPSGNIPDNQKVAYNDMSLELGGKFDLGNRWENTNKQHAEHREGINCDVRSNNIPVTRWIRLKAIFEEWGSTNTKDETGTNAPHWHTRFEYGNPRSVERTPHSFVEDAFDGALSRESTQSEYEVWFNRITLAKSQGPTELIAEAKLFQKQLFASSEYVARNRTQAEFVQDVYWTHLSREASEDEIAFWVDFMANLPPSIPANRRRARMLDEFHLLSEFEQFVLELVDPTL